MFRHVLEKKLFTFYGMMKALAKINIGKKVFPSWGKRCARGAINLISPCVEFMEQPSEKLLSCSCRHRIAHFICMQRSSLGEVSPHLRKMFDISVHCSRAAIAFCFHRLCTRVDNGFVCTLETITKTN